MYDFVKRCQEGGLSEFSDEPLESGFSDSTPRAVLRQDRGVQPLPCHKQGFLARKKG
jgi:hypothetical protein